MAVKQAEDKELDGSLKDLVRVKRHFINLVLMAFMWVASSFSYYLISFQLKYIEGDFFVNTAVSSLTEAPAYLISGLLYDKIGIKGVLVGSYIISVVGGVLLLSLQSFTSIVPVMILLAKFGVSSTFNMCYLGNALIFPTIFAGTAYGICNTFGKLATIISPMLAEVKMPTPIIVFVVVTSTAAVLALFIRPEGKKIVIPPVEEDIIPPEQDFKKGLLAEDKIKTIAEETTIEESRVKL